MKPIAPCRAQWIPMAVLIGHLIGNAVAGQDGNGFGDEGETTLPLGHRAESPQATARRPEGVRRVFRDRVVPHWFQNNTRFWYRNDLRNGTREFVVVDAEAGTRQAAFDHGKLAEALTRSTGEACAADRLPFDRIQFVLDAPETIRVRVKDTFWQCDLHSYACRRVDEKTVEPDETTPEEVTPARRRLREGPEQREEQGAPISPDGRWRAYVQVQNVFIRPPDKEGEAIRLSEDGQEGWAYGRLSWSPDSGTVVGFRLSPGDRRDVYRVESSPPDGGRARLRQRPYALPGDAFPEFELNLFRVAERRQIKPALDRFEHEWLVPRLHWKRHGGAFSYQQVDRGHQRLRVIEVDAQTGQTRNLIEERSSTFIWTAHTENLNLQLVNWLELSDDLLYVSESNGWRHIYRIDGETGRLKNAVTRGEWVVRGIDRIDETNRQVWFEASGVYPQQDPYLIHYGRVNFDGTGLVFLTSADGNHRVEYSPDRRYFLDTYSRVDRAPVTELRLTEDGRFICRVEQADTADLLASGWTAPEVFVAKGRDGKTDIWGILCPPRPLDPSRKYPVIEDIYAGPQGSYVPKTFSAGARYQSLNRLGFAVVKIDGMGTANRSKSFHDVCWHNLKDAGFEDRILWMKAAAQKCPWLDLSRVGIYGGSAGGQNAAAAVLFHPEFYKAAVADCGCHDNRMDKASWNEQWMGYPVGVQYAECSNIENAQRLQGKLFLMVAEMDDNVPPESTYRFADALIKAGKDFDLLVIPGAGHGAGGGAYGTRRREDFFVRHLLGQEPPDRNAPAPARAAAAQAAAEPAAPAVSAPPASFFELVNERDRPVAREFYKKYIDVQGMPVVAAAEVADAALQRAHWMVTHLLAGRPDVLAAMVTNRMYLIVIGRNQVYTDMPEYRHHPNPAYQNERVRGTGGRPTSFGEENLLSLPVDRYDDESIGVHEFCHTIDGTLRAIDPEWTGRRDAAYRQAMDKGLWKNTYAASNAGEFWAEICQSYFDCNRVNNWNHGPIGTREQLKEYDPASYELLWRTFRLRPEQEWRYRWVQPLPNVTAPPAALAVDPYYTKFTWAREFVVLGRGASDEALLKANDIIRKMFAYRHDLLKALIADGVRLVVLGRSEALSDLPECHGREHDRDFDPLARVLEYSPVTKLLVVSEENVLADPRQPRVGDCQVIRVLAKAFHRVAGTRPVDPNWEKRGREAQQYELRVQRLDVEFDAKVHALYRDAINHGRWQGTSAVQNPAQYWAVGVLAYFDALGQEATPHAAGHPIAMREDLQAYDPQLFALVNETMAYDGHVDWRWASTNSAH